MIPYEGDDEEDEDSSTDGEDLDDDNHHDLIQEYEEYLLDKEDLQDVSEEEKVAFEEQWSGFDLHQETYPGSKISVYSVLLLFTEYLLQFKVRAVFLKRIILRSIDSLPKLCLRPCFKAMPC